MKRNQNPPDLFEYHKPDEKQLAALLKLRAKCKELNDLQCELLPPGRMRSLAITKLEECSMWQNKACIFELPAESVEEIAADIEVEKLADPE